MAAFQRHIVLHWGDSQQAQQPEAGTPGLSLQGLAVRDRAAPQQRVMSPTLRPGFQTASCTVCRGPLQGPVVSCNGCGSYVHSQCSVGVLQDSYCERRLAQWRLAEQTREQQHSRTGAGLCRRSKLRARRRGTRCRRSSRRGSWPVPRGRRQRWSPQRVAGQHAGPPASRPGVDAPAAGLPPTSTACRARPCGRC